MAAEHGTTVNAMVREFLAREVSTITPEQQEAIDWMVEFGKNRKGEIALPLPSRDEIYAERLGRWP